MPEEIVYRYHPAEAGQFIDGVPARDLTQEDVDRLEPRPRRDLELSAMYLRADGAPAPAEPAGPAKSAAHDKAKKHGKLGAPQTDPNVPGRIDSDTVGMNPAAPVPVADEPNKEAAGGFVQSDTAPATLPQEG